MSSQSATLGNITKLTLNSIFIEKKSLFRGFLKSKTLETYVGFPTLVKCSVVVWATIKGGHWYIQVPVDHTMVIWLWYTGVCGATTICD